MERSHRLLRVNHLIAARENRQTILRLLQQQGPCSQRQLALQTRLRASTMSYIIRDLTHWGFIETSGVIPTRRTGRKEVLLKLDGSRGWAAGIDLDRNTTDLTIVNAAHEVLVQKRLDLHYDGNHFFKAFCRELEQARKDLNLNEKRCLGLGVSVAGVVDPASGMVLKSVPLDLVNHPMSEKFREKLKVPVLVEHNAICGGFAEKLLGAARPFEHFLLFLIRPGNIMGNFYGMAFYLNGAFYRGAHSSAGELDLMMVPPQGLKEKESMEFPADNAEYIRHLTRVIASLANLFDPQAIVLFAEEPFRRSVSLSELNQQVQQSLIHVPDRKISLQWNDLQNGALAYGAALMQLHTGMSKMLTTLVQ